MSDTVCITLVTGLAGWQSITSNVTLWWIDDSSLIAIVQLTPMFLIILIKLYCMSIREGSNSQLWFYLPSLNSNFTVASSSLGDDPVIRVLWLTRLHHLKSNVDNTAQVFWIGDSITAKSKTKWQNGKK